MTEDSIRIEKWVMDIQDSFNYDKESMLEAMVEQSGLTFEEFGRDYLLEEYPVEIVLGQDLANQDTIFRVSQQFTVRLKTPEEHQLELEMMEKTDGTTD